MASSLFHPRNKNHNFGFTLNRITLTKICPAILYYINTDEHNWRWPSGPVTSLHMHRKSWVMAPSLSHLTNLSIHHTGITKYRKSVNTAVPMAQSSYQISCKSAACPMLLLGQTVVCKATKRWQHNLCGWKMWHRNGILRHSLLMLKSEKHLQIRSLE
jgi:hypothetical protein